MTIRELIARLIDRLRDRVPTDITIQSARLTKRTADGEVFEEVEMVDGQPSRVLYRKEGLAPPESYADLPLAGTADASDKRRS